MPAKYDVFYTLHVRGDLKAIWEYIASDDREAAMRFVDEMERQIDTLERFPERCPKIPENTLLGTEYRHLVYGDYRTIFRIAGRGVYILRCIHGSRLLVSESFHGE